MHSYIDGFKRILFVFTLLFAFVSTVQAQSDNPNSDPALKAAVLDRILESREGITKSIEEVISRVGEITESIEKANETFDLIVETLRAQAEIGNPDGTFVGQIDRLIVLAKKDAAEARAEGYPDFEQEFLKDAEGFEENRRSAVQMYSSLDRRIRAVETQRKRIVFVIKLQRYDEAKKVIESGLNIMRDADTKLAEIEENFKIDDEEGAVR